MESKLNEIRKRIRERPKQMKEAMAFAILGEQHRANFVKRYRKNKEKEIDTKMCREILDEYRKR